MVSTYNKVIVGLLILLVSPLIVYITMDKVKIRVDADKSTFYTYDKYWLVGGREYNKLYKGTTLINRITSQTTVDTTIKGMNVYVTRKTRYNDGTLLVDTYYFNGNNHALELFPIYHTVEIVNGTGNIYQYQVKNLVYSGESKDLTVSEMSFGRNMKVQWDPRFYLAKITSTGILTVRYKVTSSYEKFNVKLFDPLIVGTLINSVPTQGTPTLTAPHNYSNYNLTCNNITTADADGQLVKNVYNWKINGTRLELANYALDIDGRNYVNYKQYNGTLKGYTFYPGFNSSNYSSIHGYFGRGGWFNGSTDKSWINISTVKEAVRASKTGTIMFWFKLKDDAFYPLTSFNNGAAATSTFMLYNQGSGLIAAHFSSYNVGRWEMLISKSITFNQWHHLAISHNGTEPTLYLDGIKNGSFTVSANKSNWFSNATDFKDFMINARVRLGVITAGKSWTDEYRLWNTSLSQVQVQKEMTARHPVYTDKLIASYSFEMLNQTHAYDTNDIVFGYDNFGAKRFNSKQLVNITSIIPHIRASKKGSIELWFKLADETSTGSILSFNNGSSSNTQLMIYLEGTGGTVRADLRTSQVQRWELGSTKAVTINQWHYLVLRHNGTTPSLFLDGIQNQTITVSNNLSNWFSNFTPTSLNSALIGARARVGSASLYFNGSVQDVRFKNHSVSPSKIQADYRNKTKLLTTGEIKTGNNVTCEIAITDNVMNGTTKQSNYLRLINQYYSCITADLYPIEHVYLVNWSRVQFNDTRNSTMSNKSIYTGNYRWNITQRNISAFNITSKWLFNVTSISCPTNGTVELKKNNSQTYYSWFCNNINITSAWTSLFKINASQERHLNCTLNLINASQRYTNWTLVLDRANYYFNTSWRFNLGG